MDIVGKKEKKKILERIVKISEYEAHEYSESIINTIRESLIVLDQDLRIISASSSFYKFFKVSPEETVGQLIYDLGNKQWNIPKLRELLENILPRKKAFDSYEVEHDFSTIGKKVMLLNARQIQRVLGKELIILLAIEDITERKKVEKLLHESEEKYRILFNTSVEGILITEIGTQKIKYANPAICKMLGYTEKELTAMNIAAIHPKEDLQGVLTSFQNQINIRETETLLLRKDGTSFYAEINGVIIIINDQKYGAGFFRDITEHKKAETEILYLSFHDQLTGLYNRRFFEEELKRFDIQRQLPLSIIMADVDGLKHVNDKFGHDKGDRLLIVASKIIKNSCREGDIIARWGGDEFIIFLPKTSEKDGQEIIGRIRKACNIQKSDIKTNISISLGLAIKNKLSENIKDIIELADKNMYIDKAGKKQYKTINIIKIK